MIVHISIIVLILAVRLCSVVPVSQVPTNHANVRQDVLPLFCQKLNFTSFTGSRHDGFIVLCATQIVKGYEGSKGDTGNGADEL